MWRWFVLAVTLFVATYVEASQTQQLEDQTFSTQQELTVGSGDTLLITNCVFLERLSISGSTTDKTHSGVTISLQNVFLDRGFDFHGFTLVDSSTVTFENVTSAEYEYNAPRDVTFRRSTANNSIFNFSGSSVGVKLRLQELLLYENSVFSVHASDISRQFTVTSCSFTGSEIVVSQSFVGSFLYPPSDKKLYYAMSFEKTSFSQAKISVVENSTIGNNRHGLYFYTTSPLGEESVLAIRNSTLQSGCVPHEHMSNTALCSGAPAFGLTVDLDGGQLEWDEDSRLWGVGGFDITSLRPLQNFRLSLVRPSTANWLYFDVADGNCTNCHLSFTNIVSDPSQTTGGIRLSPRNWTDSSIVFENVEMKKTSMLVGPTGIKKDLFWENTTLMALNSHFDNVRFYAGVWESSGESTVSLSNVSLRQFSTTIDSMRAATLTFGSGCEMDTVNLGSGIVGNASQIVFADVLVTTRMSFISLLLVDSTLLFERSVIGSKEHPKSTTAAEDAMLFNGAPPTRSNISFVDTIVGNNHNGLIFSASPLREGNRLVFHNTTLQSRCVRNVQNRDKCSSSSLFALSVELDGGDLEWDEHSRIWNYGGLRITLLRPTFNFVLKMVRPSRANWIYIHGDESTSCTNCELAFSNVESDPDKSGALRIAPPSWYNSTILFDRVWFQVSSGLSVQAGGGRANHRWEDVHFTISRCVLSALRLHAATWLWGGHSTFRIINSTVDSFFSSVSTLNGSFIEASDQTIFKTVTFSATELHHSRVSFVESHVIHKMTFTTSPLFDSSLMILTSVIGSWEYDKNDKGSTSIAMSFVASPSLRTNVTLMDSTVGNNRYGITFSSSSPLGNDSVLSFHNSTLQGHCKSHHDSSCLGQYLPALLLHLDGGQLDWGSDSRVWNYGRVQIISTSGVDQFKLSMWRLSHVSNIYIDFESCTNCNFSFNNMEVEGNVYSGITMKISRWTNTSVLLDGLDLKSGSLSIGASMTPLDMDCSVVKVHNSTFSRLQWYAKGWQSSGSKLHLSNARLNDVVIQGGMTIGAFIEVSDGSTLQTVNIRGTTVTNSTLLFRHSTVMTKMHVLSSPLTDSALIIQKSRVGIFMYPKTDRQVREALLFSKSPTTRTNIVIAGSLVGGNRHGLFFHADSQLMQGTWLSVHNSTLQGYCTLLANTGECAGAFNFAFAVHLAGGRLDWGRDSRIENYGAVKITSEIPQENFIFNISAPSRLNSVYFHLANCTNCAISFENLEFVGSVHSQMLIISPSWDRSLVRFTNIHMSMGTLNIGHSSTDLTLMCSRFEIVNSTLGRMTTYAKNWRSSGNATMEVTSTEIDQSFTVQAQKPVVGAIIELKEGTTLTSFTFTNTELRHSGILVRDSTIVKMLKFLGSSLSDTTVLVLRSVVGDYMYPTEDTAQRHALHFYTTSTIRSTIALVDSVVGGNRHGITFTSASPLGENSFLVVQNSTVRGYCGKYRKYKKCQSLANALMLHLDGGRLHWDINSKIESLGTVRILSRVPLHNFYLPLTAASRSQTFYFEAPSCTECYISLDGASASLTEEASPWYTIAAESWRSSTISLRKTNDKSILYIGLPNKVKNTSGMVIEDTLLSFDQCASNNGISLYLPSLEDDSMNLTRLGREATDPPVSEKLRFGTPKSAEALATAALALVEDVLHNINSMIQLETTFVMTTTVMTSSALCGAETSQLDSIVPPNVESLLTATAETGCAVPPPQPESTDAPKTTASLPPKTSTRSISTTLQNPPPSPTHVPSQSVTMLRPESRTTTTNVEEDTPIPSTPLPTTGEAPTPSPTAKTPIPTALPTTAPPPKSVDVSVVMPGGDEAGDVTLTTAAGTTVATSTFTGTASISSVARVSGALRVLDCPLAEDDPAPSFFEMPIQFSVGGYMGTYAGAAIGCSGAVVCAVFGCWLWSLRQSRRQRNGNAEVEKGGNIFKILTAITASLFLYLGPNSCGAAVTVFFHGDKPLHFFLAVATMVLNGCSAFLLFRGIFKVAPLVLVAVPEPAEGGNKEQKTQFSSSPMKFVFAARRCVDADMLLPSETTSESTSSSDDSGSTPTATTDPHSNERKSSSSSSSGGGREVFAPDGTLYKPLTGRAWWFLAFYGPFFDGTRDFQRAVVRCYTIPEFIASSLVQMIVGMRPDSGCADAAWGVVLVSGALFLYLVVFRPYRTKLDLFFSITLNALQLVLSLLTIIAVNVEADEDHVSVKAIGYILYILLVSYFVQVFVQAYWASHCSQRRKQFELEEENQNSDDLETNSDEDSCGGDVELVTVRSDPHQQSSLENTVCDDQNNDEKRTYIRKQKKHEEQQHSGALSVPLLQEQHQNPLQKTLDGEV